RRPAAALAIGALGHRVVVDRDVVQGADDLAPAAHPGDLDGDRAAAGGRQVQPDGAAAGHALGPAVPGHRVIGHTRTLHVGWCWPGARPAPSPCRTGSGILPDVT